MLLGTIFILTELSFGSRILCCELLCRFVYNVRTLWYSLLETQSSQRLLRFAQSSNKSHHRGGGPQSPKSCVVHKTET